jgi:hypothetical protein
MKMIHKLSVPIDGKQHSLSFDGNIVYVGYQTGNQLTFWFEFNPEIHSTRTRLFRVYGTGWEIPSTAYYRGTVQVDGFVWHLYEHLYKGQL